MSVENDVKEIREKVEGLNYGMVFVSVMLVSFSVAVLVLLLTINMHLRKQIELQEKHCPVEIEPEQPRGEP